MPPSTRPAPTPTQYQVLAALARLARNHQPWITTNGLGRMLNRSVARDLQALRALRLVDGQEIDPDARAVRYEYRILDDGLRFLEREKERRALGKSPL